ncbi:probable disease resistance protein At1g52660 [Actinidia eriantha]|uniref:probable disease resistance protein At1g52660 n=1 Tax=Actinidia eriantha TaxID=165200 RepID=UPI00258C5C23|nr:probable disease resistance protein At1g52660 [Actinidia eriantha]
MEWGVGKTTLALHIYNRLIQDFVMFGYRPYWVTLSQENSISKLQNDIAKNFKLNFSNEDDERKRAAILSQTLTRENCVLILDDVAKQNSKCNLFMRKKLGNYLKRNLGKTELSPEVRDIAMSVAAKCAGSSLIIITMAGSMREVNDIQEWRNVLKNVDELTMGH